jgi:trk system potassium uptake protein TrkA
VGGSRVAHYLAKILLPMGVRVTLVESNEKHCRLLSESLPGALILHGDGTDHELLISEHFTNNDAFIALTGRDEDNLISAMYAQQQGLRKVVAKCSHENYASVVRAAGLDSIVAPKLVTVERILRLVRALQDKSGSIMTALYRIADTGAEAAEFILRDITPHLGEPLMNLPLRKGFLIAALLHEEKVVIPSGQTVLSAGDRVIVISHGKSLLAFKDIFED